MTIDIHKPELEALIRQRLRSGAFKDVEDVLLQALKAMPPAGELQGVTEKTGADLISAMQASPYKDVEIKPERSSMPVREVSI